MTARLHEPLALCLVTKGKSVVRSALVLSTGQVVGYGCSFIRNMILARVLAKADFGLAAAFTMTIMVLELAGRMSLGIQIVQSKEGESESFLGTSQVFQLFVGSLSGLLILCLCRPFAIGFHVPEHTWAFAVLALIPLLRGLENLGLGLRQRKMEFLPVVLAEAVPQLLITAAAWPVALWLRDFRAVLYLMITKSVLTTVLTHFLSRRRYVWKFDRAHARSMLAFSWPLLANGLFLFGSQQGDQVLIGTFLSLEQLAVYSVAFSLVSIPWFIFARVTGQLMLPVLSRVQDEPDAFRSAYLNSLHYVTLASVLVLGPIVAVGEALIVLCYGSKYSGAGMISALLGIASGFRFIRLTPAIAATARADTKNQLYSNMWRSVSLVAGICAALLGGSALAIASCSILGEIVAGFFSVRRLTKNSSVTLADHGRPVLMLVIPLALGLACAFLFPVRHLVAAVSLSALFWFICLLVARMLIPDALGYLQAQAATRLGKVFRTKVPTQQNIPS